MYLLQQISYMHDLNYTTLFVFRTQCGCSSKIVLIYGWESSLFLSAILYGWQPLQ